MAKGQPAGPVMRQVLALLERAHGIEDTSGACVLLARAVDELTAQVLDLRAKQEQDREGRKNTNAAILGAVDRMAVEIKRPPRPPEPERVERLVDRGEWQPGEEYAPGDVVDVNGTRYRCALRHISQFTPGNDARADYHHWAEAR
jgi:hypothetical protein